MTDFDLTHFNSGTQKESDFLAGFIARQDSLRFFLAQLRNVFPKQAGRHQLIVAPRGYGKTSLLRRIKIAVRDKKEFNERFIALAFREEQHNVISLDIFWRNCLQSLLEAREEERASEAELTFLDNLWSRSTPRSFLPRDEQDGDPIWQSFADYCSRLDRRPILLIDNLDTLLAGIPDIHQWTLRSILQRPDGPIMIAAASKFPEAINDPSTPFHDFFRLNTLKALSDKEVLACLSELAKRRGEKGHPVRMMLENDPGRITSLNTMAGGNPRTLGVLYSVLESHMSDDVLAQLTAMLDTFTGWYQARTEELPLQSRAVFDALALNWDPMTAAAIGTVTGLDTSTVSSHLNRLEKTGYAEVVPLSKKRKGRNAYQVSERFFNIWYLMRNGSRHTRQKIRFLTIFLRSCFSTKELHVMAISKLNQVSSAESILALAASIEDQNLRSMLLSMAADELPQFQKLDEIRIFVEEISSSLQKHDDLEKTGSLEEFRQIGQNIIQDLQANKLQDVEARCLSLIAVETGPRLGMSWFLYGLFLSVFSKRYSEAETALKNAIQEIPNVAFFYLNLGNTLRASNKVKDAEKAYRDAIKIDKNDADSWHELGSLLAINEARIEEACVAYKHALAIDENRASTWLSLGRLLEINLEKFDEAEAAYRRALEIDGENARTWTFLGNVLSRGETTKIAAEEAYRTALTKDVGFVQALTNLALLIGQDPARLNEAEILFSRLSEEHPLFGPAWFNKASFYAAKGRFEEAEVALLRCTEVEPDNPAVWARLGILYHEDLQDFKKAETAYKKAIEIDKNLYVGWALLGALYHDHLELYESALNAYEMGLESAAAPDGMIYSNLVFLAAFQLEDTQKALHYAELANPLLSDGGKDLVNAALAWSSNNPEQRESGWNLLHRAITSPDKNVWKHHSDDIERVLGYSLKVSDGIWVKTKMEDNNYPLQLAPLYHAYVAMLEGDDYLQKINPEVRGVSEKIYKRLKYNAKV